MFVLEMRRRGARDFVFTTTKARRTAPTTPLGVCDDPTATQHSGDVNPPLLNNSVPFTQQSGASGACWPTGSRSAAIRWAWSRSGGWEEPTPAGSAADDSRHGRPQPVNGIGV
jgi:hypothetical protein